MRKRKSTWVLLIVLLIGLSLLLYPTLSNFWNSFHQTRAIAGYTEAVAGNGIMGYVEIPAIDVELPVYHGVEDTILQVAIGHIEGSSLPVGGPDTHCVVSGHRGLPSAKLFTDLDQLEAGDLFLLHVLDETLAYEVDQIHIVEPEDTSLLEIEEGQDLCTLVTCTPYGINSHRLLVRGHRVETPDGLSAARVPGDAMQIEPLVTAPFLAVPVLLILLIWLLAGCGLRADPFPGRMEKTAV